jgi:hypothetical protein
MHVCMYVCMYVCTYVCIFVYVYIYIHICIYIYTHTHRCTSSCAKSTACRSLDCFRASSREEPLPPPASALPEEARFRNRWCESASNTRASAAAPASSNRRSSACIRQHTSAYVSGCTPARAFQPLLLTPPTAATAPASVSIRQRMHASTCVSVAAADSSNRRYSAC